MSSAAERESLGNAAGYLRETVSTWVGGSHRAKILALADEIDPSVEEADVVSVPPVSTAVEGQTAPQPRLSTAEQVAKDKSDAAAARAKAAAGQRVDESGLSVAAADVKAEETPEPAGP